MTPRLPLLVFTALIVGFPGILCAEAPSCSDNASVPGFSVGATQQRNWETTTYCACMDPGSATQSSANLGMGAKKCKESAEAKYAEGPPKLKEACFFDQAVYMNIRSQVIPLVWGNKAVDPPGNLGNIPETGWANWDGINAWWRNKFPAVVTRAAAIPQKPEMVARKAQMEAFRDMGADYKTQCSAAVTAEKPKGYFSRDDKFLDTWSGGFFKMVDGDKEGLDSAILNIQAWIDYIDGLRD